VACASLSVASLQAMDNSKAEALRARLQQEEAAQSSQVEQLKENASKDEAPNAILQSDVTRYVVYVSGTLITGFAAASVPVMVAPAITYAVIEYLIRAKQDAAAKNTAEIVQEAVEAK